MIEGVHKAGAELLPVAMAWATPSGPAQDAVLDEVTASSFKKSKNKDRMDCS